MARQMKDGKAEARGWRGSADLWLAGAHALLAEAGVEAVKIGPLAARLGLSRTSFYWHFPDREALLAALVSRWRNTNTAALLARVEAPAASVTEAILNLFDAWVEPEVFDSAAEFAMRTGLSMGQWLTVPMMVIGAVFAVVALVRRPLASSAAPAAA